MPSFALPPPSAALANALSTGIAAILLLAAAGLPAEAQDALGAAAGPGTHVLMRHALAPGTGDPAGFVLGDCSTQRNLSEAGREQARQIGNRLKRAGVKVDVVLSSQWCRAHETAELLGLGPVEDLPALNSFFANRGDAMQRTAAVRARLAELDAAGRKAVLVTHQVNITALTDVYPASGEMLVVATGSGQTLTVEARIETDAN